MLKIIELDGTAVEYIRDQLSQGDELSLGLLAAPIKSGRIFTCLPASIGPSLYLEFGESIDLRGGGSVRSSTNEYLERYLEQFLSGQMGRLVVFETLRLQHDSYLGPVGVPYFVAETKVYYYIRSVDAQSPMLKQAKREARDYPFVAVMTTLPNDMDVSPTQEIPAKALSLLADRADVIVIGAYDDEGYIYVELKHKISK